MPPTDPRPARHPHGQILSNGRFRSWVDRHGRSQASCDGLALTRSNPPGFGPATGMACYLRDLDSTRTLAVGAGAVLQVRSEPGAWTWSNEVDELALHVTCWVDSNAAAECRRLEVVNHASRPREVELTGCAEVVLHHAAADAAHPSFSKLFVQTEWRDDLAALLARRRPRDAGERFPVLLFALDGPGPCTWETDRLRFLGRGHSWHRPAAMAPGAKLSGTVGNVLDPVLSMRRRARLAPGERVVWQSLLLLAPDAAEMPGALGRLRADGAFDASRAQATSAESARRRAAGLDDRAAADAQDFLARLVLRDPALRDGAPRLAFAADAQAGGPDPRAAAGLPGRDPLVVVDAGSVAGTDDAWRRVQSYARSLGAEAEWLLLHEGPGEPAAGMAACDVRSLDAAGRSRLAAGAAAWMSCPPADVEPRTGERGPASPPASGSVRSSDRGPERGPLRFDNGFGGFTPDGDAYVIRLSPDSSGTPVLPPAPWVNVLANPGFGCLVSETGAGFTWSGNSREHRLTHWSNDPVLDPHSEALYVRDESNGAVWSPQPGPVAPGAACEVLHRPGASSWEIETHGLRHRTTVFVPPDSAVKITRLEIENPGSDTRRVRVACALRFVLGHTPDAPGVVTECDEGLGAVLASRPWDAESPGAVAWTSVAAPQGATVRIGDDARAFFGPEVDLSDPRAFAAGQSPRRAARGDRDAAAIVEACFAIPPGATRVCSFLLGEEAGRGRVADRIETWRAPRTVDEALTAALDSWRRRSARLRIRTPEPAIDFMVNHWLPYQNLSCRMWGRSAFYQSGGAFGFRDQLQDASAMVWLDPAITRDQILLHAAHQFVEGDVLHWWHPPRSRGIRTRFADDLLWLPWIVAFYAGTTGDEAVLDEPVRFLVAPALDPGEPERYLEPSDSGTRASVYEHAARAIDRSLATGAHGLPLFGCGDWNDGMNRVGHDGRGESVWMAFFLHAAIEGLAPHAERRGESARLARWREHQRVLGEALEREGWDGAWYRRGYYGDGTPLGSASCDECRIDALAQAWSVISGAVPRERAEAALRSAERELVSTNDRLVRLLAPPFEHAPQDPGYIKGYVPGVRENGGQYTHAALWVVRAMAELGWRDRAARTLAMLSPVTHGGDPDSIARYRVEPYAIAADVYGAPPHVGRGGWTWYTGSAGWMYRVAVESVLGLGVEDGATLRLTPCLPDDWPEAHLEWRVPGTETLLRIHYRNPAGRAECVRSATLDGVRLELKEDGLRLPIPRDGSTHDLELMMGGRASPPAA